MIEHVLNLETLINDPTAIPDADLAAVKKVLEMLDDVDQCATPSARNTHALTATIRSVLAPHWRNRTPRRDLRRVLL